jgi:hypothetical protein
LVRLAGEEGRKRDGRIGGAGRQKRLFDLKKQMGGGEED